MQDASPNSPPTSAGREKWASRLGFVMAAAGSAVGLGNVWRFPWLAGENGGGLFLLIYLVMVVTLGASVLLAWSLTAVSAYGLHPREGLGQHLVRTAAGFGLASLGIARSMGKLQGGST